MPRRRSSASPPWREIALYGALLAAGATLLQWLDWQRAVRSQPVELFVALVATGFLALGLFAGWRLSRPAPVRFDGNPAAVAGLGISSRELDVLQALADGLSNKEIARRLGVSPNTVKTHVARLFEKLDATRRTDAINRARALGILR